MAALDVGFVRRQPAGHGGGDQPRSEHACDECERNGNRQHDRFVLIFLPREHIGEESNRAPDQHEHHQHDAQRNAADAKQIERTGQNGAWSHFVSAVAFDVSIHVRVSIGAEMGICIRIGVEMGIGFDM